MRSHMLRRALLIGPCAGMLSAWVAAEVPGDPWALIPALPTACYAQEDQFPAKIEAALAKLEEGISEQNALNEDVNRAMHNMDPMQTAQHLQQAMMKNPQEAMRIKQNAMTATRNYTAGLAADDAPERERAAALDDLITQYNSAYAVLFDAIQAKLDALPTVVNGSETVFAPQALGELRAIGQQANAGYEKLCAEWWQPGPFPAWFASYRDYLVNKRVPREADYVQSSIEQLTLGSGLDTSAFKPTASIEAARDYAMALGKAYAIRLEKPADMSADSEDFGLPKPVR
jgi:hypothetical protein